MGRIWRRREEETSGCRSRAAGRNRRTMDMVGTRRARGHLTSNSANGAFLVFVYSIAIQLLHTCQGISKFHPATSLSCSTCLVDLTREFVSSRGGEILEDLGSFNVG